MPQGVDAMMLALEADLDSVISNMTDQKVERSAQFERLAPALSAPPTRELAIRDRAAPKVHVSRRGSVDITMVPRREEEISQPMPAVDRRVRASKAAAVSLPVFAAPLLTAEALVSLFPPTPTARPTQGQMVRKWSTPIADADAAAAAASGRATAAALEQERESIASLLSRGLAPAAVPPPPTIYQQRETQPQRQPQVHVNRRGSIDISTAPAAAAYTAASKSVVLLDDMMPSLLPRARAPQLSAALTSSSSSSSSVSSIATTSATAPLVGFASLASSSNDAIARLTRMREANAAMTQRLGVGTPVRRGVLTRAPRKVVDAAALTIVGGGREREPFVVDSTAARGWSPQYVSTRERQATARAERLEREEQAREAEAAALAESLAEEERRAQEASAAAEADAAAAAAVAAKQAQEQLAAVSALNTELRTMLASSMSELKKSMHAAQVFEHRMVTAESCVADLKLRLRGVEEGGSESTRRFTEQLEAERAENERLVREVREGRRDIVELRDAFSSATERSSRLEMSRESVGEQIDALETVLAAERAERSRLDSEVRGVCVCACACLCSGKECEKERERGAGSHPPCFARTYDYACSFLTAYSFLPRARAGSAAGERPGSDGSSAFGT